jgi:hypothetical protein
MDPRFPPSPMASEGRVARMTGKKELMYREGMNKEAMLRKLKK